MVAAFFKRTWPTKTPRPLFSSLVSEKIFWKTAELQRKEVNEWHCRKHSKDSMR